MDMKQLKISEQSFEKLNSLALTVELLEKQRFRPAKHFDDMVALAKTAANSRHDEVRQKFASFMTTLSDDQRAFFKVLGIEVDSAVPFDRPATKGTYRGAATSHAMVAGSDIIPEGKKRIVYRGQVKWV